MTYTHRFVIPDVSGSILLVQDGAGWALPRVPSDEPEIVVNAAPALRDVAGEDIFVLREVRFGPMPLPNDQVVYVTEAVSGRSGSGRRFDEAALANMEIDPLDRSALRSWFRGDGPASPQPWQRPGWFASCLTWIEAMVPDVQEVRQVATWCNSCILRVQSPTARSYFKASPPYFVSEPVVTALLATRFPRRVPQVLALDAGRGWMLLEDLGDEPADAIPVEDRMGALIAIAELHFASVPHIDALLQGGCLDRRPAVLSDQIAALAADPTVPLPADLDARFQLAVPRLQALCAEVAASPVPATLVHGDLHAGNIMRTDGRFVTFDWTDACIADPFVDVLMFLSRLPDESELGAAFLDRYLGVWSDVVRRQELVAWTEIAEPVAAMHHAVTYRGIYDAFGDYEWWLFEGALPRWIERALASPRLA